MDTGTKHIEWNGAKQQEAIDILLGKGHVIVSPTTVGYIIMTSDVGGLERKFSAKERALNKPVTLTLFARLTTFAERLRAQSQSVLDAPDAPQAHEPGQSLRAESVRLF
jgi:tRNA A37 threonylcarbamoyladenosine synthetase subunit TsaC/SUA5/YrdC